VALALTGDVASAAAGLLTFVLGYALAVQKMVDTLLYVHHAWSNAGL
jgi:hypothetical protein